jgi:hypothetical protein
MKTVIIAFLAVILSYGAVSQTVSKPYANPANVFGSNFGDFFISMLGNQHYDMALKFTSKESIKKFGVKAVQESYLGYDYNYKLKVKSIVKVNEVYVVKFATNEFATGKFKEMRVVVENDSCKIVLQDLKIFK